MQINSNKFRSIDFKGDNTPGGEGEKINFPASQEKLTLISNLLIDRITYQSRHRIQKTQQVPVHVKFHDKNKDREQEEVRFSCYKIER